MAAPRSIPVLSTVSRTWAPSSWSR